MSIVKFQRGIAPKQTRVMVLVVCMSSDDADDALYFYEVS